MRGFLSNRIGECKALAQFLIRYWFISVPIVVGYFVVQHWLYVNLTPSLPYRLVWLERGEMPKLGELMVYRYAGEPLPSVGYIDGVLFFKRVAGVEGDLITVEDRTVRVADREIGYAKPRTRAGVPLEPIAPGVIPAGHVFAQSDSPDSFDSRYASSGLVPIGRIVGVAHPVF